MFLFKGSAIFQFWMASFHKIDKLKTLGGGYVKRTLPKKTSKQKLHQDYIKSKQKAARQRDANVSMFPLIFPGGSFSKRPSDFHPQDCHCGSCLGREFVWFNIPRRNDASRFHNPPKKTGVFGAGAPFWFDWNSFYVCVDLWKFSVDRQCYANAEMTKTMPSNWRGRGHLKLKPHRRQYTKRSCEDMCIERERDGCFLTDGLAKKSLIESGKRH